MPKLREILAHNLKKNRKKSGFSQAKLAEKVDVSTHHIAMIEICRDYPKLDLLERIADALEIEIYELFIDPHSTTEEMRLVYLTAIKKIEKLASEAINKTPIENA